MRVPPEFGRGLAAGIDRAASRATAAIAAEVPPDVIVFRRDGSIRIIGRSLATRSLVDPRLRDFAAIVRAGRPR